MKLRAGIVGSDKKAPTRLATLHDLDDLVEVIGVADSERDRVVPSADVIFIDAPADERFSLAKKALAAGRHIFLEWPPASGLAEIEELAQMADEAGVEIGVARPFPISNLLALRPPDWKPRIISIAISTTKSANGYNHGPAATLQWTHRIAGAMDLCLALAGSRNATLVEGEAARGPGKALTTVAFTLRFPSATIAHGLLSEHGIGNSESGTFHVNASDGGTRLSADAFEGPLTIEEIVRSKGSDAETILRREIPSQSDIHFETTAFLRAISDGKPAPVSIHDGFHAMKLVEALFERIR
ncbi:MAG: Gfo/Idh/MocA family oxidoreductase [Rubricoccaceae bacterium]|nr:Gfo/Idh/MocA family oxidoreductase [Rubricoccaceae bacterium]